MTPLSEALMRILQNLHHSRRNKAVLVLIVICAALLRPLNGVFANGVVTDLPVFGTNIPLSCYFNNTRWHHMCRDNNAAQWAGIDLSVDSGTTVYAAGDGVVSLVQTDGSAGGGYGRYVKMTHVGTINDTVYAHLDHQFDWRNKGTLCLFAPIGVSGSTGNSTGPHLHFESDAKIGVPTPKPASEKFTPIFGARSTGSQISESTMGGAANVSHDCGAGGCKAHTNAYTVDDFGQPSEFTIIPAGSWATEKPYGFGYVITTTATARTTEYSSDPVVTARWEPQLNNINSTWGIFVYIPYPTSGTTIELAKEVQYVVKSWVNLQGGANQWQLETTAIVVDQSAHPGEWVKLSIGEKQLFHTSTLSPSPKLTVELTSAPVQGTTCAVNPSGCIDRSIVADAVLFLPTTCH